MLLYTRCHSLVLPDSSPCPRNKRTFVTNALGIKHAQLDGLSLMLPALHPKARSRHGKSRHCLLVNKAQETVRTTQEIGQCSSE